MSAEEVDWYNEAGIQSSATDICSLNDQLTPEQICVIHRKSRHPGICRTTYFVQRVYPATMKAMIKAAMHSCKECQRINLVPTWWQKGKLEMEGNWCQIGMDVTHYDGKYFLTLTDCLLTWQDTLSIIRQLRSVFFECGPLLEIIIDNASTFRCQEFQKFTSEWVIGICYQCAYFPEGNGIAKELQPGCSVWFQKLYTRVVHTLYKVEDRVWVKPSNAQCTTRFGSGKIDEIISPQTMLVDDVPCHVKDIRPCCASSTSEDNEEDNIQF